LTSQIHVPTGFHDRIRTRVFRSMSKRPHSKSYIIVQKVITDVIPLQKGCHHSPEKGMIHRSYGPAPERRRSCPSISVSKPPDGQTAMRHNGRDELFLQQRCIRRMTFVSGGLFFRFVSRETLIRNYTLGLRRSLNWRSRSGSQAPSKTLW
jgi:hypothetical protein